MTKHNWYILHLFNYFFEFLSILLYLCGEVLDKPSIIKWALVCIVLFLVIRYANREDAPFFAFFICFVMFLVNRILLSIFDKSVVITSLQSEHSVMMHLFRSLYLSLLFLHLGMQRYMRLSIRSFGSTDRRLYDIQRSALILFYFTSFFRAIELLEKDYFVIFGGGYYDYYVSFSSCLPGVVHKLAELNVIVFFIFLSTLPDPRRRKVPFIIFITWGVLTLLYGQRNGLITALMLIVVYIILYENISNQRYKIITRRMYVLAGFSIPFLLYGLYAVVFIRNGDDVSGGFLENIETFIGNLSNSIRTIIFGYLYRDQIGHDKLYSMGKIINFVRNNAIVKALLGGHDSILTAGQTEELALKGYSYAAILTYLNSKTAYLAGHGLGSSYIAEVFHDFGYWGVVVSSFIYGKVLKEVSGLKERSWFFNAILLISFYSLLLTPRDTACGFLAAFFNFQFVISVVLVTLMAAILKKMDFNPSSASLG